ncbi:hypothetical protein [Listeria riparia]|uniref:hypothetical protein n=1 Tax=Listeria riparia TaxID=1494964 RepID=UPI00056A10E0|nr:hypothetical protein [Listeria riparia]
MDNYEYVNYRKEKELVVCEMKVKVGKDTVIFAYYFNEDNHLQFADASNLNDDSVMVIFD